MLNHADLRDANLDPLVIAPGRHYATNLEGTQLRCADLRGARLRHAILRNADLTEANLSNADLQDSALEGAKMTLRKAAAQKS
jgi:uncharacterized protein YjbI with pentapeptide repeats